MSNQKKTLVHPFGDDVVADIPIKEAASDVDEAWRLSAATISDAW